MRGKKIIRLRFHEELEKQFNDDYYKKTLPTARLALVLAFILYASFGVLDMYISPLTMHITWFIRYAVVCPVILFVYVLSCFGFFKRIQQVSISFASLVAGFGIIAMIVTARSIEVSLHYYAGLILVIMWSYTFVRLRFVSATVVCWIIVVGYEFSISFFNGPFSSRQLLNAFISNNFFFISSNIIGMFVSFHMEMYTRNDFLQRREIIENQKKIEEEKNTLAEWRKAMDAELAMARSIQQQIIPEENPDEKISAIFKPMEPIGGDFYDFIRFREDDMIGIFISDVSGHGVPAALITTMIKSIVSDAGFSKLDPSQLLKIMNETLVKQSGDSYVTAFYSIFNRETRAITYSCAGHNPPFVIHNGEIAKLDKAGTIPLGIIPAEGLEGMDKSFKNCFETLPVHSKLFLYTDGLTEAQQSDSSENRFESVIEGLLLKHAGLRSRDFIAAIYCELVNFRGGESFDDDVCMICVDIE